MWIANAHGASIYFHTAGGTCSFQPEAWFMARVLEFAVGVDAVGDVLSSDTKDAHSAKLMQLGSDVFQGNQANLKRLAGMREKFWHNRYGDREQELAWFGDKLNKTKIRADLNACLLTDEEFACGPAAWRKLDDPFFGGKAVELYWDLPKDMMMPNVETDAGARPEKNTKGDGSRDDALPRKRAAHDSVEDMKNNPTNSNSNANDIKGKNNRPATTAKAGDADKSSAAALVALLGDKLVTKMGASADLDEICSTIE